MLCEALCGVLLLFASFLHSQCACCCYFARFCKALKACLLLFAVVLQPSGEFCSLFAGFWAPFTGHCKLIPMFRCLVHRTLPCTWLILTRHLSLGEIALLAPSAVNNSKIWTCLGSPARNLRFLLYEKGFSFCGLTRLHAAYPAARRTQAASQYRRAGLLLGNGKA